MWNNEEIMAATNEIVATCRENELPSEAVAARLGDLAYKIADDLRAELMEVAVRASDHYAELQDKYAKANAEVSRLRAENTALRADIDALSADALATDGERWPPESTAIISEYDAALRADAGTPWPTDEQMITALRQQDYVVMTPPEIDTLHYAGGECPGCGQQVRP